jgi:hypothetical protein
MPLATIERGDAASATATGRDLIYKKVSTRMRRQGKSLISVKSSLGGFCFKELPSRPENCRTPLQTHREKQSQHMWYMGIQQ